MFMIKLPTSSSRPFCWKFSALRVSYLGTETQRRRCHFQGVVVVRQRQCGPKAAGLLTWLFATQPRGYQPRRTAGGLSAPPGRSRRLQRGIQRRRSAHRRRRRSRGPPAWQLRGQTPPMAGPAVTNRRPRRCRPGGNKNIQNSHVLPDQVDHSQLLRLGPDPAGVEASWPKRAAMAEVGSSSRSTEL